MPVKRTLTIYLSILTAIFMSACSGLAGEPKIIGTVPAQEAVSVSNMNVTPPDAPADLTLGALVFSEQCTRCHGQSGAGDGEFALSGQVQNVPDFTNVATFDGKTPADLYVTVTQGRIENLMPPFSNELSDMERWSVANYVYGLPSGASSPHTPENSGASASALPDTTGVISGRIIQGTADSTIPADLVVVLHKLDQDGTDTAFERAIDADGTYEFTDIPIEDTSGYYISIPYNEGLFNSEMVIGNAGESLELDVTIYERTDDAKAIEILGVITQVDSMPDGKTRIIQQVRYQNTTDRLYVRSNSEGQGLSIVVPILQGARLSEESDLRSLYYNAEDGTISDIRPAVPGREHFLEFVYYTSPGDDLSFDQEFDYAFRGMFEVYVDDARYQFMEDGWSMLDSQQFGTVTYTGMGMLLDRDESSSLAFRIDPKRDWVKTMRESAGAILVIGGVILMVISGILYLIGRARIEQNEANKKTEIEELLQQINELDARYEAKQIPEEIYTQERKNLKAQLALLMGTGQE